PGRTASALTAALAAMHRSMRQSATTARAANGRTGWWTMRLARNAPFPGERRAIIGHKLLCTSSMCSTNVSGAFSRRGGLPMTRSRSRNSPSSSMSRANACARSRCALLRKCKRQGRARWPRWRGRLKRRPSRRTKRLHQMQKMAGPCPAILFYVPLTNNLLPPRAEGFLEGARAWRSLLQCEDRTLAAGVHQRDVKPAPLLQQLYIALHVDIDRRETD